jgi:hypothetical protein
MTGWIKKTVDPPGIEKPGRSALFSIAGEVMSRVRKDAEKAFYAHFPYLADDRKLNEHGEALLIPHLPNDTPEEYRNRVAAASFFLMKAGERAYVTDQLKQRFGGRFQVIEGFLFIHTRVAELTGDGRAWVLSLFDSLTDPNIYLELSDWFRYAERIRPHDRAAHAFSRRDFDLFNDQIFRDGRIRRDGRSAFNAKVKTLRNGLDNRNGRIGRSGYYALPDTGIIRKPFRHVSGVYDTVTAAVKNEITDIQAVLDAMPPVSFHAAEAEENIPVNDIFFTAAFGNAASRENIPVADGFSPLVFGSAASRENVITGEIFAAGTRNHHFYNGAYRRDGSITRNSMMLIPLE